jgi:hypothetical protein
MKEVWNAKSEGRIAKQRGVQLAFLCLQQYASFFGWLGLIRVVSIRPGTLKGFEMKEEEQIEK